MSRSLTEVRPPPDLFLGDFLVPEGRSADILPEEDSDDDNDDDDNNHGGETLVLADACIQEQVVAEKTCLEEKAARR